MKSPIRTLIAVLVISLLAAPCVTYFTARPVSAGDPPCTMRAENLTRNGSVTDGGYGTQYGTVANEWNPFIFGGSPPAFTLADNESANGDVPGSSSQYIHGDGVQFDAGIYQTINGTQPGVWYLFSVGWAAMLRDTGGGHNQKMDGVIARRVGVDPTGGTDPHSPNVIWGPELWSGSSGVSLNNANMKLMFPAQADHVTVYVRAYDTSVGASDKVFLDVICLIPHPEMATATPLATATNTPAPTNTPRPTRVPVVATTAPKREPTKPAPVPTDTPTITNTPEPSPTPTETPKPRRAIPNAQATMDVDAATAEGGPNLFSAAVLIGSVGLIGFSLLGIFGFVAFLVWRLRRPARRYVPLDDYYSVTEPRLSSDEGVPGDMY